MAKNLGVEFTSSVASGGVAHVLDTATSYASGTLLSVRNNGTEKWNLDFDGSSTFPGDVVAQVIRRNTSDASDNSLIQIAGGGGTGSTRGAQVDIAGNEHATLTGSIRYRAGNVAGAAHLWLTEADDEKMRLTAAGELVLSAGVLALAETTTPSSVAGEGRIYTKTDNKLYFQDGAGVEKEIAFV